MDRQDRQDWRTGGLRDRLTVTVVGLRIQSSKAKALDCGWLPSRLPQRCRWLTAEGTDELTGIDADAKVDEGGVATAGPRPKAVLGCASGLEYLVLPSSDEIRPSRWPMIVSLVYFGAGPYGFQGCCSGSDCLSAGD